MTVDPTQPTNWPDPQTAYEADAVDFCRAWQSGQSVFTLQTSGSTGTPKSIQLSRAQMQASAHLTGQTLGLKAGDAALVCLNIHYVAGIMMLVRGLELGLPMTIQEPSGNPLVNIDLLTDRFDFTALVPLQLQTILDTTPEKLPILNDMKAILVGGAATSPALEAAIQRIAAPVYATYGMTETVSHIALRRLNGNERDDTFMALRGVTLGTDERSCLFIESAATNFERVQTNDVVELFPDNRFRLLGRADTIINSGGVKVQPEPVERIAQRVLAQFGRTNRLFVAGLPDERLGQRVTLVIEGGDPSAQPNEVLSAVQQAIRTEIGPYAVPRSLVSVPQFSETPTGKIDRRATIIRIR
ncbi:AMP-binding protein [Spirosoma pomorum]